jgi:hypothetical protein
LLAAAIVANSGSRPAALKQYIAVDPTKNVRLLIGVSRQSVAIKFAAKAKGRMVSGLLLLLHHT